MRRIVLEMQRPRLQSTCRNVITCCLNHEVLANWRSLLQLNPLSFSWSEVLCLQRKEMFSTVPTSFDYPSVKGHQQPRTQQATGLARDAIKASAGTLCLTRADRIEAASPHMHALCSDWSGKLTLSRVGWLHHQFICLRLVVGEKPKYLVIGNYLLHSLMQTNYHMQMNEAAVGLSLQ